MTDNDVDSFADANKQIIQDMINCVKRIAASDIPQNANKWIVETLPKTPLNNFHTCVNALSGAVVQVDCYFSGKTADGTNEWKIRFGINADTANRQRNQRQHFGGEVYLNDRRQMICHKWIPDRLKMIGRAETRDHGNLEEYQSGGDSITFGNKDTAIWICMSQKFPH